MKLPDIVQQPVGEFASGNIQQPNYQRVGQAAQGLLDAGISLVDAMQGEADVAKIDEATGTAAQEISKLRAKLVNENMLDLNEIPEGIEYSDEMLALNEAGERDTVTNPRIFTHEVSEQMWDQGVAEILSQHASTIVNPEARAKWMTEMIERYVAPGTLAIAKANAARSKAYGQAQAERAIEGIISSNAPSNIRESQAKEIIARQFILGQNPVWVENQLSALGPRIDQMDVQNAILAATSLDQIDQIEEQMWTNGNRMSPDQMRTMSGQMDARRRDFKAADIERQERNSDDMFADYHGPVGLDAERVNDAVRSQDITQSDGWRFKNAIAAGPATKASDEWTLSRYRLEISRLQFVGGEGHMRLIDKANLLKLIVINGSMGLNPNGTPSGRAPWISGTDANILNKEINAAVKASLDDLGYKDALGSLFLWTRSKYDLEGQIVAALGGNQNQIEAAIAFKLSLDNYMQQYGIDAKPNDFVNSNKDVYDPRNFSNGINARFLELVPQAAPFMTEDKRERIFTRSQQQDFLLWFSDNMAILGPARTNQISQLYGQFYQGQGVPPADQRMMLEPDDPLYHQFQNSIPGPD